MKGIINLNKYSGISSAAAVAKVRRILGIKTAGHMGTLDPLASGVLLIGAGKAARLFDYFLKKDKSYKAVFQFGTETDTLDSTGKIINTDTYVPTADEISCALSSFMGRQMQMPPAYSAKNINGQRAYAIARQGGTVKLNPSEIEIFDIKLVGQTAENSYEFDIHCSSGTYIRSLARDIAAKYGTYAIMTQLVRTRSGRFSLDSAVSLEQLELKGAECVIPIEETLSGMPRLELDDSYYKPLTNGIKIKSTFTNEEVFLLFCGGELFGIAETGDEGYIKIRTYLKD